MEYEIDLGDLPAFQPSLWDNVDLEIGLRHLSCLELDKAIVRLNAALSASHNTGGIQMFIESAQYWQPRIEQAQRDQAAASALLADFVGYPFSPLLRKFREGLLCFIADRMGKQTGISRKEMEFVFDLLLNVKAFEQAEAFISHFIEDCPGNHDLLYLLAQAQWLNGRTEAASKIYIQALLYVPGDFPVNRIESDNLKNLISTYGAAMTPAYAWIRGIAPFVTCKTEPEACNELHEKALKCYHLLQQAHMGLKNNDKMTIQYRKQLKEEAPELYEAYFALLKQGG